jgi:DNA-binding NtrC family response regulator
MATPQLVSYSAGVKRRPHVAILDSDPAILEYLRSILSDRCSLSLYTSAVDLFQNLKGRLTPELLLIDGHMAEGNTLALLTAIHLANPALPVIQLSCSSDLQDTVLAMRAGVRDVILKPFRKSDVDRAVDPYLAEIDHAAEDNMSNAIPLDENVSFVHCCKRMREIQHHCALVARSDIPVLVLGESGTGKEVIAHYIHKMSARAQQTFLKVNCAAMPAELLESELFGYEQGAFTGAIKSKPGKFEICNKGTFLLDEIGEMPPILQAKLLQVLQDGSFARLGSRSSVKVDVRVIAATNIDIKAAIAQKTFREDLYYRLNGLTVNLPPLRERRDEIPVLAQYFMRKVAERYSLRPRTLSPALLQALINHSWPGNIRELENALKRYLVMEDERSLIEELSSGDHASTASAAPDEPRGEGGLKGLVRSLKDDAEAEVIARTLEKTRWNRKAAASELQISYKAVLYKIKQYKLAPHGEM